MKATQMAQEAKIRFELQKKADAGEEWAKKQLKEGIDTGFTTPTEATSEEPISKQAFKQRQYLQDQQKRL
jgi:hypothetical protein